MARRMARSIRSTRGTTVVEFAIISILFFTIMFGILEGGRVFHAWLVITNEAREGARWGAVRVGDPSIVDLETEVENYVVGRNPGMLDLDNVTLTISEVAVTVHIDYTVEIITPLISSLWPNFPLTAESTMRSE